MYCVKKFSQQTEASRCGGVCLGPNIPIGATVLCMFCVLYAAFYMLHGVRSVFSDVHCVQCVVLFGVHCTAVHASGPLLFFLHPPFSCHNIILCTPLCVPFSQPMPKALLQFTPLVRLSSLIQFTLSVHSFSSTLQFTCSLVHFLHHNYVLEFS